MNLLRLHSFILAGVMSGFVLVPVFAQETGQQESGQQESGQQSEQTEPVQPPETEKPSTEPIKPQQPRTLYFIGPRLKPDRQQGPSVGTPKSILPQPLVPRGSVTIPAPLADPAPIETDGPDPQPPVATGSETGTPTEQTVPVDEGDPGLRVPLDTGQSENEPLQPPEDEADFQEGVLEKIDPSGLAIQTSGQPLETIWQGYDRTEVETFLDILARPSFSPALSQFASAVAASRFSLPAPENDGEIIRILEARLAVFAAQANQESYVGLINSLPADRDWSVLSRHIARAHLLDGELTDACAVAEIERARDADPYWVRLAAFCMAAVGNRTGVDFQLGILEETTQVEPVFYQLLDQILIEAEQLPGAVLPPSVVLEGELPVDILMAAMARLARVNIADIQSRVSTPLAVPLLLENPLLAQTARSKLVSYLLSRGVASSEAIAAFASAVVVSPDEKAAVQAMIERGPVTDAEAVQLDGSVSQESTAPLIDEIALQTLLLGMAADTLDSQSAQAALSALWQNATATGQPASIAPILNRLMPPPVGSVQDRDVSSIALLARAALLAGDRKAASHWSRALRATPAGQDAATDAALIAVWPLLAVDAGTDKETLGSRLALWWQAQDRNEDRFRQASVLFTVLDALEMNVPKALWEALDDGPAVFDGVSIAPAAWRSFMLGVDASDPIAALSALYRLMTEVGPADLPPAISGTLVAGVKKLGFDTAAKALALEIIISQKI